MDDVTLVYGIGAQKAGSTWLQRYLSGHPECHLRSLKEVHYFDALEGDGRWRIKALRRKLEVSKSRRRRAPMSRHAALDQKIKDYEGWLAVFDGQTRMDDAYLSYLNDGRADATVIGDVTPSYATLSEDSFADMTALSPKTRFIYLLRDPLDRAWSGIRMMAKRKSGSNEAFPEFAMTAMDEFLDGGNAAIETRSDYAGTIQRLTQVVPRENILFEFFEDLFTDAAAQRITEFLGIGAHSANTGTVVNKGTPLRLDEVRKSRAREKLQPQYEFVSQFFAGQVPARWQSNMVGV